MLFIWFINPEYSQFKEAKKELETQRVALQETLKKKQNINNLVSILDSNSSKEEMTLEYFPCAEKEEEIINMLNHSATSSGIALINFKADIEKNNSKSSSASQKKVSEKSALSTKVSLEITGSYESIRSFFDQLYRMKRINNISLVEISSQPESESLLAKGLVTFEYLPQIKLSLDNKLSDPIFSLENFDFKVVDKIADLSSQGGVSKLEANAVGRNNPFMP